MTLETVKKKHHHTLIKTQCVQTVYEFGVVSKSDRNDNLLLAVGFVSAVIRVQEKPFNRSAVYVRFASVD